MLGIGNGIMNAAALGGGGGGGAFDPSMLSNPIGIYEPFDGYSVFRMDVMDVGSGTARARTWDTGPWVNWSSAICTVLGDKAGLINAGVTYGDFKTMCEEYGGEVSIPLNTTTGWTLGAGWSIDTGAETLNSDGTTTNSIAIYTVPGSYIVDNSWYRLSFQLSWTSSDYFGVSLGDASNPLAKDSNMGGAQTDYWVHMMLYSAGADTIEFASGIIALLGTVKNITIQAVPGNHFYYPTDLTLTTDGSGIKYLGHATNAYGYTASNKHTNPAHLSWLQMMKPDTGNQPNASAGAGGIEQASSGQRFGINTSPSAGSGVVFEPAVFIEDDSGVQWVYDPEVQDTTLRCWEITTNDADESYGVWRDNSSVASGTLAGNLTMAGAGIASHNTTPDASIPTSQEGHHGIYATYIYEGERDDRLYSWLQDQTGNQI